MIDPNLAPNILAGAIVLGVLSVLGWAFAAQVVSALRAFMEPFYGKVVRRAYSVEGMRLLCIAGVLVAVVLAVVSLLSISF